VVHEDVVALGSQKTVCREQRVGDGLFSCKWGLLVRVCMCAPRYSILTPRARGRDDHVTLPFTPRVAMLSVVSRAAAGVLRGVKQGLTPQKLQNEGAKIVLSLSVNSEYINTTNRHAYLLRKFSFSFGTSWYMATYIQYFRIYIVRKV
jgi:hypothetical protein